MELNNKSSMSELTPELIKLIDEISDIFATSFKFGYYAPEDIKQECFFLSLDAIPKWDGVRPIKTFLYNHLKKRLINLKRNKLTRKEKPNIAGLQFVSGEPVYLNNIAKSKYEKWIKRNHSKQKLMELSPIEDYDASYTQEHVEQIYGCELLTKIDNEIPYAMRDALVKVLHGQKIPQKDREQLMTFVSGLL